MSFAADANYLRDISQTYSITSSARTRIDCGMFKPSALAALLFTISSSLVGNSTGRSPGLAPLNLIHISGCAIKILRQVGSIADQPARIDNIAGSVDRW